MNTDIPGIEKKNQAEGCNFVFWFGLLFFIHIKDTTFIKDMALLDHFKADMLK